MVLSLKVPTWSMGVLLLGQILTGCASNSTGSSASAPASNTVGIHAGWLTRYPHELSGGELQRIAIARTLNPQTRYLIADEMTAMLDANTQALIWQAALTYTRSHQIGVLVVSHDWPLVRRLCDRILDLTTMQEHSTLVSQ